MIENVLWKLLVNTLDDVNVEFDVEFTSSGNSYSHLKIQDNCIYFNDIQVFANNHFINKNYEWITTISSEDEELEPFLQLHALQTPATKSGICTILNHQEIALFEISNGVIHYRVVNENEDWDHIPEKYFVKILDDGSITATDVDRIDGITVSNCGKNIPGKVWELNE